MEKNYLANSPTNVFITNALKDKEQSVHGLCYYQLLSKSFILKLKITWEEYFSEKSMEEFSIYHVFWTASYPLQNTYRKKLVLLGLG